MGKMKASYVVAPRTLEMREVDIPVPNDDEVLIKVGHAGVCGSDLHFYSTLKCSGWTIEEPIVLGHECGGTVVGFGKNVHGFKEGDVVAVEPGYTCGKCEFCQDGRYNLCPDVRFMTVPKTGNVPATDGCYAQYIAWPAERVFKMPEGCDTIDAFLIEPLAVGFYATDKADAKYGQSAVILGAGTIGLTILLALKEKGVSTIIISDVVQSRLDMAKKLGATHTLRADECDVIATVAEITGGKGTDMVFEAAGNRFTSQQTFDLVKSGGHVVFVGMTPDSLIPLDTGKILGKEIIISGILRYRHCYPAAINAVKNGCKVKEIITHKFSFDQVQDAMELALNDKLNTLKVMVEF